mgnify:CR=1 FL=1
MQEWKARQENLLFQEAMRSRWKNLEQDRVRDWLSGWERKKSGRGIRAEILLCKSGNADGF